MIRSPRTVRSLPWNTPLPVSLYLSGSCRRFVPARSLPGTSRADLFPSQEDFPFPSAFRDPEGEEMQGLTGRDGLRSGAPSGSAPVLRTDVPPFNHMPSEGRIPWAYRTS